MEKFVYSDLLERKLVMLKAYQNGLKVVKYSKRVFYDALWNVDARLLDARGLVLDKDNTIVSRPFSKVFNYGENKAGLNINPNTYVQAIRKVNGYLICMTVHSKHGLIIHTTGTMDSEFVQMGRKWIENTVGVQKMIEDDEVENITFMFEVCDPSDPHIVKEESGLYLLGARCVNHGIDYPVNSIFHWANIYGVKTPEAKIVRLGDLLAEMPSCRHEGYMVRDVCNGDYLFKIKSPYYLVTKFLARNNSALKSMLEDPKNARKHIDEEFYGLIDALSDAYGLDFLDFPEQKRIEVVENYFKSV